MPRRTQFGGPSEIFPNEYSSAPRLVDLSATEHDARNPGHTRYSGLGNGVAYGQRIPDSALRELTYNANADQRELHQELHPYPVDATDKVREKIDQKYLPGAMGSYSSRGTLMRDMAGGSDAEDDDEDDTTGEFEDDDEAEGEQYNELEEDGDVNDDARHGYQIFLSSSSKHAQKAKNCAVDLAPGLDGEVRLDGSLPAHRTGWHCAEQGMVSDHHDANAGMPSYDNADDDDDEDRVFVVDPQGRHMAPCGHATDQYGCEDFCRAIGARDVGDYGAVEEGSSEGDEQVSGSDEDDEDVEGEQVDPYALEHPEYGNEQLSSDDEIEENSDEEVLGSEDEEEAETNSAELLNSLEDEEDDDRSSSKSSDDLEEDSDEEDAPALAEEIEESSNDDKDSSEEDSSDVPYVSGDEEIVDDENEGGDDGDDDGDDADDYD
ncbi:hypothetical protein CC86DRAFT_426730 [Ophiobolus disseminans]|uniref:Uncharacterized protein n=1 Tax=Ophiobolus disseminans TaxID=1469910 RepID=A0A6A6ZKH0_9PLEO|nr:hypothetical protein CC86DRAFT_426730 [Ophiobolus disseminans]